MSQKLKYYIYNLIDNFFERLNYLMKIKNKKNNNNKIINKIEKKLFTTWL